MGGPRPGCPGLGPLLGVWPPLPAPSQHKQGGSRPRLDSCPGAHVPESERQRQAGWVVGARQGGQGKAHLCRSTGISRARGSPCGPGRLMLSILRATGWVWVGARLADSSPGPGGRACVRQFEEVQIPQRWGAAWQGCAPSKGRRARQPRLRTVLVLGLQGLRGGPPGDPHGPAPVACLRTPAGRFCWRKSQAELASEPFGLFEYYIGV